MFYKLLQIKIQLLFNDKRKYIFNDRINMTKNWLEFDQKKFASNLNVGT